MLYLDHAIVHAARTNNNLPRYTNQIHARELCARTLVTVIEQRIKTRFHQFLIKIASRCVTHRVTWLQIDHGSAKRGHRIRPDNALVIMARLDDTANKPRHANAIGSHMHRHRLAIGAGHSSAHRS